MKRRTEALIKPKILGELSVLSSLREPQLRTMVETSDGFEGIPGVLNKCSITDFRLLEEAWCGDARL